MKELMVHRVNDKICAAWAGNYLPLWKEYYRYDAGPDGISGKKEGFYFANLLMPFTVPYIIDGVAISPDNYPKCVIKEEPLCPKCSFFLPKNCPIYKDFKNIGFTHTGFNFYKEWVFMPRGIFFPLNIKNLLLFEVAWDELLSHGRPLHYSLLATLISKRHPYITCTERKLFRLLKINPVIFLNLGDGVFQVGTGIKPNKLGLEKPLYHYYRQKYEQTVDLQKLHSG